MTLLCFACFRSRDVLDFDPDVCTGPPRLHAQEPPLLSLATTNLFDTFPRIVFGGYRRYYETHTVKQACLAARDISACRLTNSSEPSMSSIAEDPWSWQNLPKFTGRKPRRRMRRTNSSLRNNCPRLRKKARFHASVRPLVDSAYPWPNWPSTESLEGNIADS